MKKRYQHLSKLAIRKHAKMNAMSLHRKQQNCIM